jgi:hypothetical protein
VPEHKEGTSFVPLIDDPERAWKGAAFSQYPRQNYSVMGYTMRTERYRYTEWWERETGEVLASELYDHQADPLENVNCAQHAAYAETVQALAAALRRGWRGALP